MKPSTRKAVAGIVAGATLLGGTGAALAHGGFGPFGGPGGGNQTALLNDVASRLNVSGAALRKAVKDAVKAQVDQQVKDGLITKEVADEIKARIDKGAVHVGVGPAIPGDLGVLKSAAAYLGLTAAELQQQFKDGKSLADIAKDKGKSVDGLEAAIVAGATTQLAAAVAAGDLTDAQRDQALTRLKNSVDELVAHTPGLRFHRLRDGQGFGFRLGGAAFLPRGPAFRRH
jgi:hypothetical protein